MYRSVYDSTEAETVAIEQPNYPDETKQDLVQQSVRFWDFLREKEDALAARAISEAGLADARGSAARPKCAAGSEGRGRSAGLTESARLPKSARLAESAWLADTSGLTSSSRSVRR